jgi:von Willebrand factor type A domain.
MTFLSLHQIYWIALVLLGSSFYFWWYLKKRALASLAVSSSSNKRTRREFLTVLALMAVFFLALLDPAGPGYQKEERLPQLGPQPLIVAIDQSLSMGAIDSPNGQSREGRAKAILVELFDKLKDFSVSIWSFGEGVYPIIPFTEERVFLKFSLEGLDLSFENSDFNQLFESLSTAFKKYGTDFQPIILIVTDGEHRGGGSIDYSVLGAAEPLFVNVLMVGSVQGAQVPRITPEAISKANPEILKALTSQFNGVLIDGNAPLEKVLTKLESTLESQRGKISSKQVEELYFKLEKHTSYAYVFILLGLSLVLIYLYNLLKDRSLI